MLALQALARIKNGVLGRPGVYATPVHAGECPANIVMLRREQQHNGKACTAYALPQSVLL